MKIMIMSPPFSHRQEDFGSYKEVESIESIENSARYSDQLSLESVFLNEQPLFSTLDTESSCFSTNEIDEYNMMMRLSSKQQLYNNNISSNNSDSVELALPRLRNNKPNSFIGNNVSSRDDYHNLLTKEMGINDSSNGTMMMKMKSSQLQTGASFLVGNTTNVPVPGTYNNLSLDVATMHTASFEAPSENDDNEDNGSKATASDTASVLTRSSSMPDGVIFHPATPELGIPVGGVLHAVCSSVSIPWQSKLVMVRSILQSDKTNASQPLVIYGKQKSRRIIMSQNVNRKQIQQAQNLKNHHDTNEQQRLVPLPYKYPINLVIINRSVDETTMTNSNLDIADRTKEYKRIKQEILDELIIAEPSVLLMEDGPVNRKTTTLHLLLQYMPDCVDIVDAILFEHPDCAMLVDFRGNTPLHIAILYANNSPECLSVIQHLFSIQPQAMIVRNRDGVTPIQLAERRTNLSEEIAEFIGNNGYQV